MLKRVLFLNSCPGGCQQLARRGSWPLADNKMTTATGLFGNLPVMAIVDLGPWSLLTCGPSVFPSPALSHSSPLLQGQLWGVLGSFGFQASAAWAYKLAVTHSSLEALGELPYLVVLVLSQHSFMSKQSLVLCSCPSHIPRGGLGPEHGQLLYQCSDHSWVW